MTTSQASPAPVDASAATPAILLEAPATAPACTMTSDAVARLEKLSLEEEGTESTTAAMEEQEQVINTEMLSAPSTVSAPSQSQVFAPRPIRAPFPGLYRPIPQRLPKPMLVQLDESPMARSPSPVIAYTQHRRSSSAASTLAAGESRWNAVKLLESRLAAGETTEADEANEGSNGDANNVLFYSSPSKDVLDELYKIIRSNKAYPLSNFRELSATSPSPSFYRNRTPTKTPSSPSQHRRKISDAATPDSQLITRSPNPEREWNKVVFPSSPISRTTMRNPILFNSQFGTVSAD
ncbi:hypothetical protein L211DRAFT_848944 [Terfezia boudieri ATCC MYA-4762]|uniref:Uncharacterized protein n=1 Tax=Terfezia boudieri ATCC MYA-4762 TaxID=1051890 RepID=A0A3N4LPB0_9PEZI|nr:hypothetical protein L211DRAFT_848944 [Terfezia boudieri ATCC MYA-4762]